MSKIPSLKKQIMEQAISPNIGKYVWDCGIGPQMGYSFSEIHSLAYSFIGFQTMFIATNWNPIYWNTACLLVNSGALVEEREDIESEEDKTKEKTTDYGKIAKAIGDIVTRGIKISLIDINKSSYGFEPDPDNNEILFGLKALSNVGAPIIEKIIAGRPYADLADFMVRCPLNKSAMFSLIKGGAFDKINTVAAQEVNLHPRIFSMIYYISKVCDQKKRLTLQNFNGLITNGLIPSELNKQKEVFLFNKYLKTKKKGSYYILSATDEDYYKEQEFDLNNLEVINGEVGIKQTTWEKIYKSEMEHAKNWIKSNHDEMLAKLNQVLFKADWDKYAKGNVSSYEMDALCFYYHEHELAHLQLDKYGIVNFDDLSPESEINYFFKRNGRDLPIYTISRIVGTVIGKNDNKSSVTLLTTNGVVGVKFTKEYYAKYKKQISEQQADGTKKVLEKGWFGRGNKLLISGYRRDDTFVAKTYKNNSFHQLYKITDIKPNGTIELVHDREGDM